MRIMPIKELKIVIQVGITNTVKNCEKCLPKKWNMNFFILYSQVLKIL